MLKTKCRRPLSIERGQEVWRPLKHHLDDHLPHVVVAFVHSEEFHFAKMTFCTDAAVAQPTARVSVPKPRLKMSLAPIQTPATPLVDAAVADALMAEHTKAPKARAVQAATLTLPACGHGLSFVLHAQHIWPTTRRRQGTATQACRRPEHKPKRNTGVDHGRRLNEVQNTKDRNNHRTGQGHIRDCSGRQSIFDARPCPRTC